MLPWQARISPSVVKTSCLYRLVFFPSARLYAEQQPQNLGQIEDLRNQFYDCLIDAGFVGGKKEQFSSRARTRFLQVPPAFDTQSADAKIVMSCLAAGMYPKLLVTDNSGVFRTLTNNAAASIHPSSINFSHGKKPDFGDSRYAVYCNVIATKKLCRYLHLLEEDVG